MVKIFRFFDKFEDGVRQRLSRTPIFYAVVGGAAIVLFWRGIWDFSDVMESMGGIWSVLFSPIGSIVVSVVILLATGLFVSFFIGESIIISGLKREKKIDEKTEEEVEEEEVMLKKLEFKIERLEKEVASLADFIRNPKAK